MLWNQIITPWLIFYSIITLTYYEHITQLTSHYQALSSHKKSFLHYPPPTGHGFLLQSYQMTRVIFYIPLTLDSDTLSV